MLNSKKTSRTATTEKSSFSGEKKGLKILGYLVSESGVSWYRMRQLLEGLERYTDANVFTYTDPDMDVSLSELIKKADIILTLAAHRPMFDEFRKINPYVKIVIDRDDNTHAVLPENEAYGEVGVRDIWANGIPVWVTGITPRFDAFKNRKNRIELEEALFWADLVTTTTEQMRTYLSQYARQVGIVPNAIDFDQLYFPEVEVKDTSKTKYRIGWHGGVSHHGDFQDIAGPLTEYLNKTENVEFYSVGAFFEDLFEGILPGKIRSMGWVSFQAHPLRLRMLDFDTAIIPLEELTDLKGNPVESKYNFNSHKSSIKWYEFAALKVPCVVANLMPYNTEIKDKHHALLYDTPEQAIEALELLRTDEKLRKRIVDNAYNWVKANRSLEKVSQRTYELYKTLFKEEE